MVDTTRGGGLPDVDQTEQTPDGASVSMGGKGPKATVANESVLANMERLFAQKQAQTSGFGAIMEGLKDASAWTSGGMHGPTEALALRQATKEKQARDLFDMQTQIASQKSAIANRNAFYGAGGTGTGSPAGVAGAGGGTSPGVAQGNTASGGLLNLVEDPALRAQIGATYLQDPTRAMGQLNAYLAKRAEAPDVKKKVEYAISLGYPRDQALNMALVEILGPNAFKPFDVRGAGGTTQSSVAQSAGISLSGGPGVPGAPAGAPAGAPTGAAPGVGSGAPPVRSSLTGDVYVPSNARVAADANNPSGIMVSGRYAGFPTPEEGVAATQRLVGARLAQNMTPDALVGMWVTGDPKQGATVANGNYLANMRRELQQAGVQLNRDGTIPNTPAANDAITRAIIRGEAPASAVPRFLPFVGASGQQGPAQGPAPAAATPVAVPPAAPVTAAPLPAPAPATEATQAPGVTPPQPFTTNVPRTAPPPVDINAPTGYNPGTPEHDAVIKMRMESQMAEERARREKEAEEELKNRQRQADLEADVARGAITKEETDAGPRRAAIIAAAQAAPETLGRLTEFQNLITESPNAIGSKAIVGPKGVTLDILDKQKTLPIEAETALRATMSPKDYENRRALLSLTASLALEYQRQMLQGQGAVSNYERQYAERAKGLGDENSPARNLYFAKAMEHKTRFTQDVYKGWIAYEKDMQKQGRTALYSNFEKTDYYNAPAKVYTDRLQALSGGRPMTGSANRRPLSSFETAR
jgi:hypothetical protein